MTSRALSSFYNGKMDTNTLEIIMFLLIIFISIIFGFLTTVGHMRHLEPPVEKVEEYEDEEEEEEEVPLSNDIDDSLSVDAPEEEITKSDMDYLKAQLAFYREERSICEGKMANSSITLENYNSLKKYWDGLNTMIAELQDIIE